MTMTDDWEECGDPCPLCGVPCEFEKGHANFHSHPADASDEVDDKGFFIWMAHHMWYRKEGTP